MRVIVGEEQQLGGDDVGCVVVDVSAEDEEPNAIRMANPELLWVSDDAGVHEEGCLSLPEYYAEVDRPDAIKMRYLDYDSKIQELETEGVLSTCIQHEMDHLDGKLIVDYASSFEFGE